MLPLLFTIKWWDQMPWSLFSESWVSNQLFHFPSEHSQQKIWKAKHGCNLKNNKMISIYFQGKPFNITVVQVYASTTNAEEPEIEQHYEDV